MRPRLLSVLVLAVLTGGAGSVGACPIDVGDPIKPIASRQVDSGGSIRQQGSDATAPETSPRPGERSAAVEPPPSGSPVDTSNVIGSTDLSVATATGGYWVCFRGTVSIVGRLAGTWLVTVVGTSTATPIVVTGSGATISGCRFYATDLPGGEAVVTFEYLGLGTTLSTTVLAASVGEATWAPIVGSVPIAVDLNNEEGG